MRECGAGLGIIENIGMCVQLDPSIADGYPEFLLAKSRWAWNHPLSASRR
jgi:hypothetical protein